MNSILAFIAGLWSPGPLPVSNEAHSRDLIEPWNAVSRAKINHRDQKFVISNQLYLSDHRHLSSPFADFLIADGKSVEQLSQLFDRLNRPRRLNNWDNCSKQGRFASQEVRKSN